MNASNTHEATPLVFRYGIPAPVKDTRTSNQKRLAVYFILASTLFERIAFYALMTTIFTTLRLPEPFHWETRHSKTAAYIFAGISYISTLIFAVITDAKVGRARTIIIGFGLYLIGFVLMTLTATGKTLFCHFNETDHHNATVIGQEQCVIPILGTLICTGLGAGAIKSNLAVFGAEQIQESKRTTRYFDKYAVAVNIGSIIPLLAIPYIQTELEHQYYFIPYLLAASMLFFAAVSFLIGWRYYLHVKTNETVITKCIPVFIDACRSWYRYQMNKRSRNRQRSNSTPLNVLNVSHSFTEIEDSMSFHEQSYTFLDFAKLPNGGFHDRIVEDVKSLRGALIVFTLLIPFWLVYNQINATFPYQGEHMKRPSKAEYVVYWMSLGDPITIILGVLVLNIFVYKYLNVRNRPLTITTKFVIGMGFACLSMCAAGVVEVFRQRGCKDDSPKSELSIFVQLPQNILIGFSQLFAMVASYEYAYFAAPLSAQSLFMSLHFCSIGMSVVIGSLYYNVFPKPNVNINFECQKDKQWDWSFYTYFFILAGVQFVFMIIFIICYKKFRLVKLNRQHMETRQLLRQSSTASMDEQ